MPKKEISYKDSLPLHQAMSLLENLVDSLKKGAVCIQVAEEYVLLNLDGALPVEVQISASEKKGKNRITVELTWREADQKDPDNPIMTIGSQPPRAAEDVISPEAPAKQSTGGTTAAPLKDKTDAGKRNSASKVKSATKRAGAPNKIQDTKIK